MNKEFLSNVAKEAGLDRDNMKKGLCVQCGRPALEHCTTDAGRRETKLSGLCEECWDGLMGVLA